MNAELTFLNALQALRTPALDGVMRFFTHLGDSGFVWLALTALCLPLHCAGLGQDRGFLHRGCAAA